ncbi:MAG: restriction endonuclease subunit S [Pseudomonadota bacterium]
MRQEGVMHRHIPSGWIREELGNLAEKITKGATPTTYGYEFQRSGINFIKIQNVFAGAIDLASITDFISEDAHQNQKKSILKVDDVLFSIAGTIGETSIVKQQHLPANTNQAFAIISGFSELLLPKYLEFQLRSFVSQKTKEKARGGAMNNVSLDDLKHLELLLPPLNEQHRIVAKIEELFSELDKGIEVLKTAREQLKVYRQALLKHAFEGKLTAAWRDANPDKLEPAAVLLARIQTEREQRYQQQLQQWQTTGGSKPKAPKPLPPLTTEELAELPELPEGWGWVRLMDVSDQITDGTHHTPTYVPNGVPFISVKDIRDGVVSFSECKYISEEEHAELCSRCKPEADDLLITKSGTIGRLALVPEIDFSLFVSVALVKTQTMRQLVLPKWFLYAFEYHLMSLNIDQDIKGGLLKNYHLEDLRLAHIPLASTEEQQALIMALEERITEIAQLDLTLTASLQQSEALRQSILKRAFSGQLVTQDPHDEPAAVLLARIRAEKDAQSAQPRKSGKGKA